MPMYKKSLVALLFIAIAVLGGTIYGSYTSDDITQLDAATVSKGIDEDDESEDNNKSSSKTIFVYVTGAVNKPGMVELTSNKDTIRVAEAVEACGGLLPTADSENFNMAEPVTDGQHIRIPEKIVEKSDEFQTSTSASIASPSPTTKTLSNNTTNSNIKAADNGSIVNINTASAEELATLKGIGPKTAEKIIEYRQNNGPFKSIEEIQNVRGIGAKKFENIKSRIRI